MAKNKFQADKWLAKKNQKPSMPSNRLPKDSDIEIVTRRIETTGTDITVGYANWRDLGFALSEELGERGRGYFHRISRLNPGYNQAECDRQFDRCLKAHGTGITIKTFFQAAKDNGINVRTSSETKSAISAKSTKSAVGEIADAVLQNSAKTPIADIAETADSADLEPEPLPTFSDKIHDKLPDILRKIAEISISNQDSDMLILGALTVISACLPHVSGVYADRTVFPNLFLFVTANASSGKGRLTLCRSLVEPIHKRLREINEAEMMDYKQKLAEYNAAGKKKVDLEKPEEPPMRMLFIPANSSATAVYQVLNDNEGTGLMFETEGDTLANTFGSDYGNYSDGFRKAFHHEPISYIRRKDREYVDIKQPRLSTLLTGTPRQILNLITDAENGLFSRFAFYMLDLNLVWNDVFTSSRDITLDVYFARLGKDFYDLNVILKQAKEIRFILTEKQREEFNRVFEGYQEQYYAMFGNEFVASVRRLGVITFRIAMILTTLRIMETGDINPEMICSDPDFECAMAITAVILKHNARVFKLLPALATATTGRTARKTQLQIFFDKLPQEFDRKEYSELAASLGLVPKSIDRTIKKWCAEGRLDNPSHGKYVKI